MELVTCGAVCVALSSIFWDVLNYVLYFAFGIGFHIFYGLH